MPGGEDELGQRDLLGAHRLTARERHEIVDDGLRQARVALDLEHVRERRGGVDPRQVRARRDHLEHVPELVGSLGGDFAYHRQALACVFVVARDRHGFERTCFAEGALQRTLVPLATTLAVKERSHAVHAAR
jgi:hypothetical protein